jgi:hypothetical protein
VQLDGGGQQLFRVMDKELPEIIAEVYPEHNWERYKFGRNNSKYWEELFQGNSY